MKKRTYIQPKMMIEELCSNSSIMIPSSPGSDYNPGIHAPTWRPKNPTRTPVF